MRELAQRWYHWRWTQRFFTDAEPVQPDVPLELKMMFPLTERGAVNLNDLTELCANIDGDVGYVFSAEALRLAFLMPEKVPGSLFDDALACQLGLVSIHRARKRLNHATREFAPHWGDMPEGERIASLRAEFMTRFEPGQNLSNILSFYVDVTKRVNRLLLAKKAKRPPALAAAKRMFEILEELDNVLGLLELSSDEFLNLDRHATVKRKGLNLTLIEQKVSLRMVARTGRDWTTADRLKTELNDMGIVLSDEESQTDWWFDTESPA